MIKKIAANGRRLTKRARVTDLVRTAEEEHGPETEAEHTSGDVVGLHIVRHETLYHHHHAMFE